MDIELQKKQNYKNFKQDFEARDLNSFVILTGRNGVGKSQLLQIIEQHTYINPQYPQYLSEIHIDKVKLEKDEVLGIFSWEANNAPGAGLPEVSGSKQNVLAALQNRLNNNPFDRNTFSYNQMKLMDSIMPELHNRGFNNVGHPIPIEVLDELLPLDFFDQSPQIFNERIATIIFDWHLVAMEEVNKGNPRPAAKNDPINIFNKLCKSFDIKYKLDPFVSVRSSYSPFLVNSSGDKINWSDLSSGEKVILRIICWLFYNQLEKAAYPKLLVLDEPDAHLSPAMIHRMLNTIQNTLIEEMGISVIMTTHSPNTVALAEEKSLYELRLGRSGKHNIVKISRKEALTTFSDGLLFVEEDTRLVFVEGKDDVSFYENALKVGIVKYSVRSIPSIKFIPASKKNPAHGGCEEVKKTLDRFEDTSIERLVYGIIDNDNSNTPKGNLLVLDRYAIENYLFDPIVSVGTLVLLGQQSKLTSLTGIGTNALIDLYSNRVILQASIDELIAAYERDAATVIAGSGHTCDKVSCVFTTKYSDKPIDYELPKWFIKLKKAELMPKVIHRPRDIFSKFLTSSNQHLLLDSVGGIHSDILELIRKIQT